MSVTGAVNVTRQRNENEYREAHKTHLRTRCLFDENNAMTQHNPGQRLSQTVLDKKLDHADGELGDGDIRRWRDTFSQD